MKAIAQREIISLIADINSFAESAEQLINSTQTQYESDKRSMLAAHRGALDGLEQSYNIKCSSVNKRSRQTITDARYILKEIDKMDIKLSEVDKYYVKTKTKKLTSLIGVTSEAYADATDYFNTMDRIRQDFDVLYRKYSEDILPGILNGLNYLFSSKRKKDYEDLIILRNTVAAFLNEIEETLPAVTKEHLDQIKGQYMADKKAMLDRQKRELADLESRHDADLDNVADKICADLDEIIPDEFAEYLCAVMKNYADGLYKVNNTSELQDEVLSMIYIDYPVDVFVSNPTVASVIKDKCRGLMCDNNIRLPMIMSSADAPVWLIDTDNSNPTAVQDLIHSVMFGMLSSCPVSKLNYRIVDPENRGNSISPYFDAKKKLPELFCEKIIINKNDVADEVSRLNGKIENILQNKLGTRYSNVFDYARDNDDYSVSAELLLLFDFPRGFDERTLSELRNILRNGSRCGVYTVIMYTPDPDGNFSQEYRQNLESIISLSSVIKQSEYGFTYMGLPILYFPMPENSDFSSFFSKYMLIFEGIKNRGIAFSPLIKGLADAKETAEVEGISMLISEMMKSYREEYGKVPAVDAKFPSVITLGNVLYPADIFSDSVGYKRITELFGVRHRGNTESDSYVELPLTFDLGSRFNLLLNCPESKNKAILSFTHHVIRNFLSFIPVTKVNVCVFDGEQRGNSVIPFLDFRKKSPDTFDGKIYTSQEDMIDRLRKINSQIDDFIQEKLGNRFKDILDYNLNTPNRAEPLTLLVLYDFPSGMDGRAIDLLINILRNGNKCGVYTMICYNPGVTYSRYDSIDERMTQISKYCAAVDFKENNYCLLPYNLQINIPPEPSYSDSDAFIKEYVGRSVTVKKQGLSFRDIMSDELFSSDSSKSLSIPIGIGDGDSIVSLKIGEGSSHHGLIAGATGSGKSTLLHTLIMSSMLHYTPEQLNLYLMDFKSGTEFKIYESVKLPHIRLLALDAMQEFGESILENLVSEMERRGTLFKEAGQTGLSGYKAATGKQLPRILVIMDEFQILFNDSSNRKVAMNCAELTKRIVTEGRAFGIHLLMATQSTKVISDLTLSHGTIEQMRIRIGLKCGENDARYLFSDQNDDKALTMMKGPIGTAVMNLDYTEQSNIGFRAAYCDERTQKEYLDLISRTFADRTSSLQTFEGSRTTDLLDFYRSRSIGATSQLPVQIHLGSLIKVAPPFAISIDRKKKHNLLICGSSERMANTVSNDYIISALLNLNSTVYCIDGDKLVGDDISSGFYNTLSGCTSRFKAAEDRSDIITFINEIYSNYLGRKKHNGEGVIFVVIKNLQFLDIIQTMFKGEMIDESEFLDEETFDEPTPDPMNPFASITDYFDSRDRGTDNTNVGEKLLKLIHDGSGFGIHFVVSSLEYQVVRECMYYGESILSKFPERIIFSLGANDADNLIENVNVTGLRDNTVYFTDGVKNTFQLKPYVNPTDEELEGFLNSIY